MNLLTKQDMSLNSNFYADQFNSLPNTFYKQDEMLQRLDSRDCMLCVVEPLSTYTHSASKPKSKLMKIVYH